MLTTCQNLSQRVIIKSKLCSPVFLQVVQFKLIRSAVTKSNGSFFNRIEDDITKPIMSSPALKIKNANQFVFDRKRMSKDEQPSYGPSFVGDTDWIQMSQKYLPEANSEESFKVDIRNKEFLNLYNLPVDNEEYKSINYPESFDKHIFINYNPKEFPNHPGVRHLMNNVVRGLRKNPHITLAEKNERIDKFKDYFAKMDPKEFTSFTEMFKHTDVDSTTTTKK